MRTYHSHLHFYAYILVLSLIEHGTLHFRKIIKLQS